MKQLTEKGEKRRQKKELTNFYRFQIKESKMKSKNSLNFRTLEAFIRGLLELLRPLC